MGQAFKSQLFDMDVTLAINLILLLSENCMS